ncbi:hypothetical protein EGW08_009287 [Elysia chlorotica]|uniref:Uncharacterized protein n=1 Tax=Elysia chlorotica TaxID=188477 RepID=A0A433TN21_ELYCH|nr:hypothetical protein EGW08_009287 [Elysia chlorotica]
MSPSACSSSPDPSSFKYWRPQPTHHRHLNHTDPTENHTEPLAGHALSAQCPALNTFHQPLVDARCTPDQPQPLKLPLLLCISCRAGDNYGPRGDKSTGSIAKSAHMHIEYNECMRRRLCQCQHKPLSKKLCHLRKLEPLQRTRLEAQTASSSCVCSGSSHAHMSRRSLSGEAEDPPSTCSLHQSRWLRPVGVDFAPPTVACREPGAWQAVPAHRPPPTARAPATPLVPKTGRCPPAHLSAVPGHAPGGGAFAVRLHGSSAVVPLWGGSR